MYCTNFDIAHVVEKNLKESIFWVMDNIKNVGGFLAIKKMPLRFFNDLVIWKGDQLDKEQKMINETLNEQQKGNLIKG